MVEGRPILRLEGVREWESPALHPLGTAGVLTAVGGPEEVAEENPAPGS